MYSSIKNEWWRETKRRKHLTSQFSGKMTIDAKLWMEYVQTVKDRDSHRKAAEQADKERRKNWRNYYVADKRILELNKELGIDESFLESDDEEIKILEDEEIKKTCPGAPKKRKVVNN